MNLGGNTPHIVFISSQFLTGNMGGLAAADSLCQSLASLAGFAGTFKAWLSDSTQGPAARFTHAGYYVRPDGVIVANTWSDLTSGNPLANPIICDEHDACGGGGFEVWTSTRPDGTFFGSDSSYSCLDWTYDLCNYNQPREVYGGLGLVYYGLTPGGYFDSPGEWPNWNKVDCCEPHPVYCFQQ
jgi:hypothetical protein